MVRLAPIFACLCGALALVMAVGLPLAAQADDKRFSLAAPASLVESGLLDYLLPRFSLKTGVRIEVVPGKAAAEATLGTQEGRAVFTGSGETWRLRIRDDHPGAVRFVDWLTSEIGRRTVTSYEVAGTAPQVLPICRTHSALATLADAGVAHGHQLWHART